MRELLATSNATPSSPAFHINANSKHLWNTPIPYLFGSIAVVLLLIAFALVLLLCSCHHRPYGGRADNGGGDDDDQKPPNPISAVDLHANKPKIVVIMAGDENPTYLAMPVEVVIPSSASISATTHDDDNHDHDGDDQDQREAV